MQSERFDAMAAFFALMATLMAALSLRTPGQNNPVAFTNQPGVPNTATPRSDGTGRARIAQSFGKLPLSFEANQGQTDGRVKFLSRGSGYTLFLTANEAVLALRNGPSKLKARAHQSSLVTRRLPLAKHKGPRIRDSIVRMTFMGANRSASVKGIDSLAGKANYFIGNDPTKWRTDVPTYAKVEYKSLYPGIDLVYYGSQTQLEYDFVAAPGADPRVIRLALDSQILVSGGRSAVRSVDRKQRLESRKSKLEGPDSRPLPTSLLPVPASLRVAPNGDLVVRIEGGQLRFHKPVVYQPSEAPSAESRVPVAGHYRLAGRNLVSFEIGSYDHTKPLVIDPTLSYSTYLGGSGQDEGTAVAVNTSGDAYVTGQTNSIDFPVTAGVWQQNNNGKGDVFVTELNPTGSGLIYSTYLGGSNFDAGESIVLNSAGDAFVTGQTSSDDFPVTPRAFQPKCAGVCSTTTPDAFVTELNSTGSALLYSTYLGGTGFEQGNGIALDRSGHAFVVGWTDSVDFPVTPGDAQGRYGGGKYDAFVIELSPGGSALLYSTYLGGSDLDVGYAIALDLSGNAYVTGYTMSTNFPTVPGAFQTKLSAPQAAFVTKLNTAGSALVYSTYLGGSGQGTKPCAACGAGITVDGRGNAYVSGLTWELNFPTTPGAFQTKYAGGFHDAFLTKLNSMGSQLVYSTYVGGMSDDGAVAIKVDSSGTLYVRGNTFSKDFPVTRDAFQSTNGGAPDAFFLQLNPTGSALDYSTYLGGSGSEFSAATSSLDIDSLIAPNVYLTGYTNSANYPTTAGAFQATFGGVDDAFVAKFAH